MPKAAPAPAISEIIYGNHSTINMANKERFLVVSGYFPPIVGGASTVMSTLLAKFRPDTFSVIAESPTSFDGDHRAPLVPDVKVTRIGVPAFVTRKIPYGVKSWCVGCVSA